MNTAKKGFTLIELLVVISIIGILAVIVAVVLNPLEMNRRSRDTVRLADFASLEQAINVAAQESTQAGGLILCNGATGSCSGSSYAGTRATNGTGWVKIDLGQQNIISLGALPVDPTNSVVYHYTYCANADKWELSTKLESTAQATRLTTDGGNDPVLYEIGTNLLLTAPDASGSCTY